MLALLAMLPGCGADWFPAYHRQPTTPDNFSFAEKDNVAPGTTAISDAITVSGLTATTSPISVSGPAPDSMYIINGGTPTSTAGTVSNGDTVQVAHTAASIAGGFAQSTLTIGNVSATFTSRAQLVALSAFTTRLVVGTQFQTRATVSSIDTATAHTISIDDSNKTATFAIADANLNPIQLVGQGGSLSVTNLNNQVILVRKDANSTTTLTIDGLLFPVTLPAQ
ncbi:hypothetical protein GMSM_29320 [Geomonas sp. Red276]